MGNVRREHHRETLRQEEPGDREGACTDSTVSRKAVSLRSKGVRRGTDCFDRVLWDDPANVKMWNKKGSFSILLGRPDALDCWGKALDRPGFCPAWVSRGCSIAAATGSRRRSPATTGSGTEPDSAVAWAHRSGVFVAMHRLTTRSPATSAFSRSTPLRGGLGGSGYAHFSSTGTRRRSAVATAPSPTIPERPGLEPEGRRPYARRALQSARVL